MESHMSETTRNRRTFFKELAAGAAVLTVGPTACARSETGSNRAASTVEAFGDALRAAGTEQQRWQTVRDQFLLEPGYSYFNTGGLGPSPEPVVASVDSAWRDLERHCETGHGRREAVHEQACSLFGCGEDELAFTRNATESMNLVVRGLRLRDGDEIVMTTHEHPGGATPWFAKREEQGIRIRTFEPGTGGGDTIDRLRQVLTARTRVVMVSHITCTHGLVLPIQEISALCRERGILTVIDGAQAVGQIPVDLHGLGCDFYVASGHKWLLAPKGSGLLYVRDEMLDSWKPSYVGAYSDAGFDLAVGRFERLRPATASEYGTRNTPLLLGLGAAFDFLNAIGIEAFMARGTTLAARLRERLTQLSGVEVITPAGEGASASILAFRLPESGGNPWDWCNLLRREHDMRLRPVGEAGLNAVRASTHVCNSEDEVDRLAEVLGQLA
jgi:selenocysteine lyase/cysteine desulfurase